MCYTCGMIYIYVLHRIHVYYITFMRYWYVLHVRHDRFMCVTSHSCVLHHSHAWLVCATCAAWSMHVCYTAFMFITSHSFILDRIHIYSIALMLHRIDVASHSLVWHSIFGGKKRNWNWLCFLAPFVWHDSCMSLTWTICMCTMNHLCVCHESFICMCVMNLWFVCVCDESFICMCVMNHSLVWHDLYGQRMYKRPPNMFFENSPSDQKWISNGLASLCGGHEL